MSSFLLQDISTHSDRRLFDVREAINGTAFLFVFRPHIRAYIAFVSPPPSGAPCVGLRALRAADAGPLINALNGATAHCRACIVWW